MNTNQDTLTPTEQPNDTAPQPKRRRNGFIARLYKRERDLVNQMLLDGSPYRGIVCALDELGHTVTERCISNWARGGHQDWLREQERIQQEHSRQDRLIDLLRQNEATNLPEVGLQAAATVLSELLTQCSIPLNGQKPDLAKYLQVIRTLCRLSRELFNLQQYRDEKCRNLGRKHSPEAIKEDSDEFLEELRQQFSESGLAQMDAEIAADEARNNGKEEPPHVPQIDAPLSLEPRPDEPLTVTVLRDFLQKLKARKQESAASKVCTEIKTQ